MPRCYGLVSCEDYLLDNLSVYLPHYLIIRLSDILTTCPCPVLSCPEQGKLCLIMFHHQELGRVMTESDPDIISPLPPAWQTLPAPRRLLIICQSSNRINRNIIGLTSVLSSETDFKKLWSILRSSQHPCPIRKNLKNIHIYW